MHTFFYIVITLKTHQPVVILKPLSFDWVSFKDSSWNGLSYKYFTTQFVINRWMEFKLSISCSKSNRYSNWAKTTSLSNFKVWYSLSKFDWISFQISSCEAQDFEILWFFKMYIFVWLNWLNICQYFVTHSNPRLMVEIKK